MNIILQLRYLFWGPCTILLMLGIGIYFTICTHGVQFWCVKHLFAQPKQRNHAGISPFQALCTSLGSTLGIGNLAGVATAITLGGVGAVFYMMLGALVGMATKYAELVLAVRYHTREKMPLGGPMVYLSQGAGCAGLAKVFAVFCIFSVLTTGATAQGSAIAQSVAPIFGIPYWLVGVVVGAVLVPVLYGGRLLIARIASLLVPVMTVVYVGSCLLVLVLHADQILPALQLIVTQAFSPLAMGGGLVGLLTSRAISDGFAKGMFSNEAGMGSAPIVHGSVQDAIPCVQGMLGAVEVFIDTCVMCLLTALVLIVTGAYTSNQDGLRMTITAFESIFGGVADIFIAILIVLLSISTILGWSFYGIACLRWLHAKHILRVLYPCAVALITAISANFSLYHVLIFADIMAACMTFPNLIGLWLLRHEVTRQTDLFLRDNTKKRLRAKSEW